MSDWIQCDFIQLEPLWVESACGASGGGGVGGADGGFSPYTYDGPVRKTDEDVRRGREALGIIPKLIAEVAAGQAKRLEQDAQKRFEELERELQAKGIQWKAEYLEALNAERGRLIDAEIAFRLRMLDDELTVMMLVAIAATYGDSVLN